MKSKWIALVLAAVLCIGSVPVLAEETEEFADETKINFSDVSEEDEAYDAVMYLAEQEIITGKSETEFYPQDSIKREEAAKIFVNAFGLSAKDDAPIFYDVPANIWYASYVSVVAAHGFMQGVSETEFGIGNILARQDLAVILKRFLDEGNVDLTGGTSVIYADSTEVSDYAKNAVETLCAKGIIDGREDNLWCPREEATRAETAIAIYRALMFKKEYNDSLGRMAPMSQYDGPYDVPTDDRLSELRPAPFDASALPQMELAYEDFEDSDYGVLTASGFGTVAVFDSENGYESKGCIKVTGSSHAQMRYKAAPGEFQPGEWLVFTAMVKGEGISGSGDYRNLISVYDDNGKWVTEAGVKIKKDTEWTECQQLVMVKEVVNALTETEYYTIGLGAYMNNLTGTCYFDNFKLSKVVLPPMDTVLMTPNYKGIVKGDDGVGDIALRAYINDGNGYYDFNNLKLTAQIADQDHNVLLKSESDTITNVMDIYFSSKTLPMGGDYYLETILSDKDSGEELQKRDWALHKREADFETTIGYDEYGRITKNGEPVFPVASYCAAPYAPYVKDFSESGVVDGASHSGVGWYYKYGTSEEYRGYINKLAENGVDMWLNTGDMWLNGSTGEISSRVKNYDDIRGLLTKIVNNFKDLPNLFSYYIWDERNPVRQGDELTWINRIIDSLDLNHPTTCAVDTDQETRPGVYSRTADFLGYDPYPFTGKEDQDLSLIYDRLMVAKQTNPNRPIYLIPQGFWYNKRGDLRGPNLDELRCMVFQGLCADICMICTYRYGQTPSPGRTPEEEWEIQKSLYGEIQYLEPIILSVLPAPYYEVKGGGEWLNTIAKRYDGKSYLFTVNNENESKYARIYLDGVNKIQGMYSKKTYTADADGWFTLEFDGYATEIFEYEQADYKSSHAELTRFGLSDCMLADSESDAYFLIPEDMKEAEYNCAISDQAALYINGNKAEKSGKIDLAGLSEIKVKVVSEDGRSMTEKTFPIQRIRRGN